MVIEIEKAGIATAHITNMTAVAKGIGSPRIIPGVAITSPCSDVELPMAEQLKMRKNYVDRAIEAISANISTQTFF